MHSNCLVIVKKDEIETKSPEFFEQSKDALKHYIMVRDNIEETDPHHDTMYFYASEEITRLSPTKTGDIMRSIESKMDKYCWGNEDNVEFEDTTDEYRETYDTDTMNAIKYPDGSFKPYLDTTKYIEKNGKIYRREFGRAHTMKSTKRSKKYKVVTLPISKMFKSFDQYADYMGLQKNDEGEYGFYYNPNGICDWYAIGGRWDDILLVKEDCEECVVYPYPYKKSIDVPKGYKWVSACPKKYIEWDVMKKFCIEKLTEMHADLVRDMENKEVSESTIKKYGMMRVDGNKITSIWGGTVYEEGTSLEDFIEKRSPFSDNIYTNFHSIIDEDGYWSNDIEDGVTKNMIDNADPDDVICIIDLHM